MKQFWGKYRGTVVDNEDPMMLGRLQIMVPQILGEVITAWAMPCAPYAGMQVGFYMMPPVGAAVWAEFEGGDPNYPIWSGCFWREGELPVGAELPTTRMIQTGTGRLVFNDLPGEGSFTLSVADPAVAVPVTIGASSNGLSITLADIRIAVDETGVTIVAEPGRLAVTMEGITIAHGSATVTAIDPDVTISGGR